MLLCLFFFFFLCPVSDNILFGGCPLNIKCSSFPNVSVLLVIKLLFGISLFFMPEDFYRNRKSINEGNTNLNLEGGGKSVALHSLLHPTPSVG